MSSPLNYRQTQQEKLWVKNQIAEYHFNNWLQRPYSAEWLHPLDYFLEIARPGNTRFLLFKRKGYTCVNCGIVGDRIITWQEVRQVGTETFHTDLFASRPNGTLVMMTKDHIIPKSKGGTNNLENLQPMCSPCNEAKGNMLEDLVF